MFASITDQRLILDAEKEELRVQVNTLKYELESIKQERELEALRHEKELRELQLKADADFRKAQVCLGFDDCYYFGLLTVFIFIFFLPSD